MEGIREPGGELKMDKLILNQIIYLSIAHCAIFPLFPSLSKTIRKYSKTELDYSMNNQVNQ